MVNFTWDAIAGFMDDPGARWLQAYESLSQSEKALLVAMLDSNFRVPVDRLKRLYEGQILGLPGNTLTFEACLRRMSHSFIRVIQDYGGELSVDFQHPSLRDMLLERLSQQPNERLRYIRLASPRGVANLLQGMADVSRDPRNTSRFALITSEDELTALLGRISDLTSAPIEDDDWRALLSSVRLFIPSEPMAPTGLDRYLGRFTTTRLEPHAVLNSDFPGSIRGKILEAIVVAFADHSTYERNSRFRLEAWTSLIQNYFELAKYVRPTRPVAFLAEALTQVPTLPMKMSIDFLKSVAEVDPISISQAIPNSQVRQWSEFLQERANALVEEMDEFLEHCPRVVSSVYSDDAGDWLDTWEGEGELYDLMEAGDFVARWRSSAEDVLDLDGMFDVFRVERPRILRKLRETAESGEIPEYPESPREPDDEYRPRDEEFWSVAEIFADL